jgi:LuxR family transcriptional regulator, quorum-sensing system regulator SolR
MSLIDRHLHTAEGHSAAAPLVPSPAHTQKVLTVREREILTWIAEGKSDAAIGQILNISSKTVNFHVENAKRKFAVATRIQAVIVAMRNDALAR